MARNHDQRAHSNFSGAGDQSYYSTASHSQGSYQPSSYSTLDCATYASMSLYSEPQNCYPPSQMGYELRNHGHLSSSSANQNMTPIQAQNTFAIPGDQLYYGSQQSNWPTHSALNQPQTNQVLHQLNMGYYSESREGLSSPSLHHMRTYKGQSSVSIPEMVPGRVEDLMNTGSSRSCNSIIGTGLNSSVKSEGSPPTKDSPDSTTSNEGSSPGESSRIAKKRPQSKGYISTLDTRLSRLESMLTDLMPASSERLESGAPRNDSTPRINVEDFSKPVLNRRLAQGGPSSSMPAESLINGEMENKLLAGRPILHSSIKSSQQPSDNPRQTEIFSTAKILFPNSQHKRQ
ncbi:hypothetical protein BY996DRAFT_6414289 [Phakopsora pachyrhizi]|uniref:Expressed protein n=1 Tax=Phakopsora pachyrhizi TaxID=170000 RepID=A0AAV0BQ52_PHAPC|nr:hypothetical protein BY996DRAFT_6414289 [Phakopsora pachyrhizi]CAH7688345.1 expressed protein [Phakopsora pachyrhizi]